MTAVTSSTISQLYLIFSSISLVASLFVVFCYLRFPLLRVHPSSLIFYRSIFDCIFCIQFIIFFAWKDASDHCPPFSFLFQMSVLGSQSWYFTTTVDLMRGLTNPFSTLSAALPYYHAFVWSTSIVSALVVVASRSSGYRPGMEICWTATTSEGVNALNWIIFFVPTLVYYVIAIVCLIYAAIRLRHGVKQTFAVRARILYSGALYVMAFTVYWTIAGALYFYIFNYERNNGAPPRDNIPIGYAAFAVTIAIRAFIDTSVWVYNTQAIEVFKNWWNSVEPKQKNRDETSDINMALRREVLVFTSTGIGEVCQLSSKALPTIPSRDHYPKSLSARSDGMSIRRIMLRQADQNGDDIKRPFTDYAPYVFHYLRSRFGIQSSEYHTSILGENGDPDSMIERYTEGRSASFFYFTSDNQYIVKTLKKSEAEKLLRLLPKYAAYMAQEPNSLVTKLVGLHAIRMYSKTIYMVVMQSVFRSSLRIHERYDLKGSWVDRWTPPRPVIRSFIVPPSQKLSNQPNHTPSSDVYFPLEDFKESVHIPIDAENDVVNEPIQIKRKGILKDNDLNHSIILSSNDRRSLLHQLRKDAFFLAQNNIMDYSLLLGVHNTRHEVSGIKGFSVTVPRDAIATNEYCITPADVHVPAAFSESKETGEPITSGLPRIDSRSPIYDLRVEPSIFERDDGGIKATIIEGPAVYFFGIIDILQDYNTGKKFEHIFKVWFRCKDRYGISAIPPIQYARRFIRAMQSITVTGDNYRSSPGSPAPEHHSSKPEFPDGT